MRPGQMRGPEPNGIELDTALIDRTLGAKGKVNGGVYQVSLKRAGTVSGLCAVPYKLSQGEAQLYKAVTDYVRQEFNRAEALQNDKRAGTVGFALTILQRRLASSPEAIYQSLRLRKERLESRLRELELLQRAAPFRPPSWLMRQRSMQKMSRILRRRQTTKSKPPGADSRPGNRSTHHRRTQGGDRDPEAAGRARARARRSGTYRKWRELANLLSEIFTPAAIASGLSEESVTAETGTANLPKASASQKLVIFTEHRDTLSYL